MRDQDVTSSAELRVRLPRLRATLANARITERAQLGRRPVQPDLVSCAKADTMDALTAYVEAIESLCWPVPRELRAEINLRRTIR
ncbi:MAG: hypothetical protein KDB63_17045 [Nocardioidaceae bacterium]|nr:hypothetical protein [Nocardioidaceae bacterium]